MERFYYAIKPGGRMEFKGSDGAIHMNSNPYRVDYLRDRFAAEISKVGQLERIYAAEKIASAEGKLREGQTRQDLVQGWKKSHRAKQILGDLEEAHRSAQTYALATLVEQMHVLTATAARKS